MRGIALVVGLGMLSGCAAANSGIDSALGQVVGANWGPCGGPRDRTLEKYGEPARRIYGDESDLSEDTKAFEQEWVWRVPPDSARVVTFRWGNSTQGCQVSEEKMTWKAWEQRI